MKVSIVTALFVLVSVFSLPPRAAAEASVGVVFSEAEVSIIATWYHDQGTASNKGGNKKQKGLPPGIAKNLARGKPLPPGISKKYLPDELRHALPPPPKGYERIIVDGKVARGDCFPRNSRNSGRHRPLLNDESSISGLSQRIARNDRSMRSYRLGSMRRNSLQMSASGRKRPLGYIDPKRSSSNANHRVW